jgi:DNA segregation ATPase FtsK/SpoIIIE-like protein
VGGEAFAGQSCWRQCGRWCAGKDDGGEDATAVRGDASSHCRGVAVTTPEEARLRLQHAHAALSKADEALGRARELAQRASAFVEETRHERDSYVELDRDIELNRAAALKAKLRSGSPLEFEAVPLLSKNAAALVEA